MQRKAIATILLGILIIAILSSFVGIRQVRAQSRTWIVDDDGPADFNKIQDAINAAQNGDTISVRSGTYIENVVVNKTLTLIGEDRNTTIVDGSGQNLTAVKMTVSNVRISGFTIQKGHGGVLVQQSNGVVITNNHLTGNVFDGLSIEGSHDSVVTGNLIDLNTWYGIFESNTENVTVQNNVISSNQISGTWTEASKSSIINFNTLNNNTYYGLYFENTSSSEVIGNSISLNHFTGIYMLNLTSTVFYNNNFVNNTQQIVIVDTSSNAWDSGVEGNFWSDFNGTDVFSGPSQNVTGSDGISDTPYVIDSNNKDNYPLMNVINFFDAGTFNGTRNFVHLVSNSTVSNFQVNATEKEMSFNLTVLTDPGYCRVTIPKAMVDALWHEGYRISIDGTPISASKSESSTYAYNYFKLPIGEHKVAFEAVDIAPPTVTILSPENKTYPSKNVDVTFTLSEPTSWRGYSLDGQGNLTITGNITLSGLSEGVHRITVFANDTAGNMGGSGTVYFSIDTIAPTVVITSPQNTTYQTSSITLRFTVSESSSWMAFSLDGQANQTIQSTDTTISSLSDGLHSLIVYVKDAAGNTGASQKIIFTINAQQSQNVLDYFIWIAIAAIAIIVVIAAIALYWSRIRKRAPVVKPSEKT